MASKGAKKAYCQLLLQEPSGAVISTDSKDGQFLLQLLQSHPEAAMKFGCGISHFAVEYSAVGHRPPSQHFVLHRTDGTCTDFSYNKCISSKFSGLYTAPPASSRSFVPATTNTVSSTSSTSTVFPTIGMRSPPAAPLPANFFGIGSSSSSSSRGPNRLPPRTANLSHQSTDGLSQSAATEQYTVADFYKYAALRDAIFPEVLAFKQACFLQGPTQRVCAISGVRLTWENTDIGHAEPNTLKQLVQGWLACEDITLDDVELTTGDNTAGTTMADLGLKRTWQAYHRRHATLRAVSKEAHRVLTARRQREQAACSRWRLAVSTQSLGNSSSAAAAAGSSSGSTQRGAAAPAGSADDIAAQLARVAL